MTRPDMKLLLVGPCPPPHGGISVHVATAREHLRRSGAACRVLDPDGDRHGRGGGRLRRAFRLWRRVRRHAREGWAVHLHTNGHNSGSWLVTLLTGLAARRAPARLLTLHSGMAPEFLEGGRGRRALARLALAPFDRVVCVNRRIRDAVASLGVGSGRLEVAPAWLPAPPAGEPAASLAAELEDWLRGRRPLLVTTLWFRPEYGFEVLVDALARLAPRHPALGCLVLGGGEGEAAARRLLRERDLADRVRLAGDVPHAVCLAAMARSHLFVRPTLADGDAVSVREALSLGLPVVATDTGGRPPGVAALVPPGDPSALAQAVEAALVAAGEPARARRQAPVPDSSSLDSLLHTYREVACRV